MNAKTSERSRTKTCRPAQLKIKTKVRAGGIEMQHNQTRPAGLKIKTNVRAGGMQMQHNLARA